MSTAQVWIDGVDVTSVSLEGSSTRRLNRPSQAQVKLPMESAIGGAGSRLKIAFDNVLHHHGTVLLCETDTSEDVGYTVYNSTDPLELWKWRPVRDVDGDFSDPTILQDYLGNGPTIIEQMIINSESAGAGPPDDAEGPLFLDQSGQFPIGGVDLSGAPVDWPMTMAELASLLMSTGELDIVLTPIDTGGNMARIDTYHGDYGTDLSGSLIFEYGMGARNIRNLRWNQDMTNMANKIWYYLGPRLDQQHWRASITGYVPSNANWAACQMDPTAVIDQDNDSQNQYGVRMDIRIYDGRGDEATIGYCLYRRLWLIESWLRAVPLQMVHITPIRDFAIGQFDIGDLVTVQADSVVRGGFSGVQRVYEYTISWDEDSVLELSELQTSAGNEGIS